SAVGALDESGEPNMWSPLIARLLVRAADGRLMTGPDVEQLPGSADENPQSRHSLVPLGPPADPVPGGAGVMFRYNPIARRDADFVLWYRFAPADGAERAPPSASSRPFEVHVRWFADDGRILMWQSSPYLLDVRRND